MLLAIALLSSAFALIALSGQDLLGQSAAGKTSLQASVVPLRVLNAQHLHEESHEEHGSTCDCSQIAHCYMCFENESAEKSEEHSKARGRSSTLSSSQVETFLSAIIIMSIRSVCLVLALKQR